MLPDQAARADARAVPCFVNTIEKIKSLKELRVGSVGDCSSSIKPHVS